MPNRCAASSVAPPGRNSSLAQPDGCIVAIHGCLQNPEIMAKSTGLNELGDKLNYIVVYAHGTPFAKGTPLEDVRYRFWGGVPDWKINPADQTSDLQFIADLSKHVQSKYNLGAEQMFVAGYSGGGVMGLKHFSNRPNEVAGIFTVSASLTAQDAGEKTGAAEAGPSMPTSVFQVFGKNDMVIPEALRGRIAKTIPRREAYRALSELLGMPERARVERNGDSLTMTKQNESGAELTQVVIRHPDPRWPKLDRILGHRWPDEGTEMLGDFILRHRHARS